MDTSTFVGTLREIRNNLRNAQVSNAQLEIKLAGASSAAGEKSDAPQPPESVGSLLADISRLSIEMVRFANGHHSVIGEFTGKESLGGTASNLQGQTRYA